MTAALIKFLLTTRSRVSLLVSWRTSDEAFLLFKLTLWLIGVEVAEGVVSPTTETSMMLGILSQMVIEVFFGTSSTILSTVLTSEAAAVELFFREVGEDCNF